MRYKYLSYLLIAFVITAINSCKCNPSPNPQNNGEQVFVYTFEKTPAVSAENTKQMVTDYLGIKNVHDLTINKDENVAYFVSDSDLNVTFEQNLTNGNFEFSKLTTAYNEMVPKLPAKEEAIKIAENYLKSKNIFPKNTGEFKLVHNGGVRSQAVLDGQRGGPIVDKLITLTYGRVLDSMPVVGAGSKIVVNIGNNGEVVGVNHRWRELNMGEKKQLATTELITKSAAEELAKRQIISEFGQAPYEIKSSTKSYYDGNGSYLQPVWAFNVMVNLDRQDKNAQAVNYLCIIPMLQNPPEPIFNMTLDPKAKQIIKEGTGRRDSTQFNRTDRKDND